jgi:hypothetical protein
MTGCDRADMPPARPHCKRAGREKQRRIAVRRTFFFDNRGGDADEAGRSRTKDDGAPSQPLIGAGPLIIVGSTVVVTESEQTVVEVLVVLRSTVVVEQSMVQGANRTGRASRLGT